MHSGCVFRDEIPIRRCRQSTSCAYFWPTLRLYKGAIVHCLPSSTKHKNNNQLSLTPIKMIASTLIASALVSLVAAQNYVIISNFDNPTCSNIPTKAFALNSGECQSLSKYNGLY